MRGGGCHEVVSPILACARGCGACCVARLGPLAQRTAAWCCPMYTALPPQVQAVPAPHPLAWHCQPRMLGQCQPHVPGQCQPHVPWHGSASPIFQDSASPTCQDTGRQPGGQSAQTPQLSRREASRWGRLGFVRA